MPPSKADYRPDIDGLRAVAVMAVVIHHLSAPLLPGGYVGVDVFFVISGYLITRIISREMEEGSFTFARFYERRARRIFPALFAVLTITLAAGYLLLLPSDYAGTLRGALGTLFFASNVVFWRDMAAGYFAATDAGLNPLLHTWSLAVEEQFYVFFPVLLLLSYRHFRHHIILVLVICALVSLTSATLLVHSKSVAVFFLSPFRAWELLTGSLLAFNAVPAIRSRLARELTASTGLAAILLVCFIYDEKTAFPAHSALAPVLGTAAILHAGTSGPTWIGNFLQWRPVLYTGLISYSLYLWHWPLIVLVRYTVDIAPTSLYVISMLMVSLVLASLSYHFIERPIRLNAAVTQKLIATSTALSVLLFVIFSFTGLMHSGYKNRFTPEVTQLDIAHSQHIPFLECDNKDVVSACILGHNDATASILLWGDSHMLAWAPALHEVLTAQNIRAVFTPTSACPPMFGVKNNVKDICISQNSAIKDYLLANPNIKTVVMAAFWSYYFKDNGPVTATTGNLPATSARAIQAALNSTIRWLRDHGIHAVLIGPVPVYDQSVPKALALEKVTDRTILNSSMEEQRQKNVLLYEVSNTAKHATGKAPFSFIDPIQWMCSETCIVMKDSLPVYRDANHLSVAGAMALKPQLNAELHALPGNQFSQ